MGRLLDWLVRSNLWISIGAGIWAWSMLEALGNPMMEYGLFVFFATLAVYNYQRIIKEQKGLYSGQSMHRVHPAVQFVALGIGAVGSVLFLYLALWNYVGYLVPFVCLAVFYVIPKTVPKLRGLRSIPGLKLFIIAASWSGLVGFLPCVLTDQDALTTLLLSSYVFCFIAAITIPFDIRDLKYDPPTLKTLPQVLGVKKSKVLAGVFMITAVLLAFALRSNVEGVFLSQSIVAAFCFLLLKYTRSESKPWLFSLGFDGSILLLGLLQLAVGNI